MKTDDLAGKQIEAFLPAELLAFGEEQLKPQADAKKRFLVLDQIANGLDQPESLEILHAGAERANTREYNAARRLNLACLPRHHRVEAAAFETLLNAAQISHAVINNRNHTVLNVLTP